MYEIDIIIYFFITSFKFQSATFVTESVKSKSMSMEGFERVTELEMGAVVGGSAATGYWKWDEQRQVFVWVDEKR